MATKNAKKKTPIPGKVYPNLRRGNLTGVGQVTSATPKVKPTKPVVAKAGPTAKQVQDALKKLKLLKKKDRVLVKDVFADVFADLQHLDAFSLKVWAMKHPTEFYTLCTKLIPIQIAGDSDNPLHAKITFS